jgi:NAD(P)-dependent dehydrogenase (short-subunit alcohol dehydrogenase family)
LNNLNKMKILVTGATGYLGSAIAIGLAKLGAEILVNGRNKKTINKLVNIIKKKNCKAIPACFDLRDNSEIKNFFTNIKSPLNCIISNAYDGKLGTIETLDAEDYLNSIEISVIASHNLIKSALPYLKKSVKKNGDASFINISSMYGVISPNLNIYPSKNQTSPPTYGVSKAGIIQWTRYAAQEFGTYGIRVNSISPGPFPKSKKNKRFIKILSDRTALRRIGNPRELVGPVAFLCSNISSYITGANIIVDGGWTSR